MYTDESGSAPESVEDAGVGTTCLEAALIYRKMGWSVIPIKPGTKSPDGYWKRFQEVAANEDVIRHWWNQNPERGVAVVQGSVSGIVAVDIDSPEANDRLMEISKGDMPPTWLAETTPGQKWRLLYRLPPGEAPRKRILWHDANGKELAIMGDGSQVLMPPSKHPLGHCYRWLEGGPDAMPEGPVMAPKWLLDLIVEPEVDMFNQAKADGPEADQVAEPDHHPTNKPSLPDRPQETSAAAIGLDARPGDWLNMQPPDALLERLGLEFARESDQRYYHRVGSENEVGATAKIGSDGKWNVQIHSSSIQGFPPGHYDQIGILAKLDHGADVVRAASAARILRDGPPAYEGVTIDIESCLVEESGTSATHPSMQTNPDELPYQVKWLDNMKPVPMEWLVSGLIPRGVPTAISGDPGSGKTSLVRAICCHQARGTGVLSSPSGVPVKSLWVCAEDDPASSMVPAAVAEGLTLQEAGRIGFASGLDSAILDPTKRLATISMLQRDEVQLLVVDTLALLASVSSLDLNSGSDVRRLLGALDALCKAISGLTVVIVCHTNRDKENHGARRVAGSQQLLGSVRLALLVESAGNGLAKIREVKTNLPVKVETRQMRRVALLAAEAAEAAAAQGFTIDAIDDEFANAFCRQEIILPGVDVEAGLATIGFDTAPALGSARATKAAAIEESEIRRILHKLKTAGAPVAWSEITDTAAHGVGERALKKARAKMLEQNLIKTGYQPGRGTTRFLWLAEPESDQFLEEESEGITDGIC